MYYYNKNYHIYKFKDKYFCYNIDTKAVSTLSRITYLILKLLENSGKSKKTIKSKLPNKYNVNDFNLAITELINHGLIKKKAIKKNKSQVYINRFIQSQMDNKYKFTGLYLVVSQDCNLRCKYCSADFGRFGRNPEIKLMSIEMAKKALDFFFKGLEETLNEVVIVFVGGEPLLNFELIKEVSEYCKTKTNKELRFLMNTNGTLMTAEKAEWLVKNNFDVRFSIDGPQEKHDVNRIFTDGSGSYVDALIGLNNYLRYSKSVMIQSSIAKAKNFSDTVRHLWTLGARFIIANYIGHSNYLDTHELELNKKDMEGYIKEYNIINDEIIDNLKEKGYSNWISPTDALIKSLHKRTLSDRICGIGQSISITPEGTIFLCQGLVGNEDYSIGTIEKGINFEKLESFGQKYADYLNICDSCWAKNSCISSCVAQDLADKSKNHSVQSRSCDYTKETLKAITYTYSKMKEEIPDYLNFIK